MCFYAIAVHSPVSRLRPSGKQYATTYAAKEVQVGIAVTRPPCNDDFWAIAMRLMHKEAKAIVMRIYLYVLDQARDSAMVAAYKRWFDTRWH